MIRSFVHSSASSSYVCRFTHNIVRDLDPPSTHLAAVNSRTSFKRIMLSGTPGMFVYLVGPAVVIAVISASRIGDVADKSKHFPC